MSKIITNDQFYALPKEKQAILISDEELQRQADVHLTLGNTICYPQPEKWGEYVGTRYGVDCGNDTYLGSDYKKDNHQVFCWTPHKDIAEQIVKNVKKCGWKFKDACVIELTYDFLKSKHALVCTHAGFQPLTIQRNDEYSSMLKCNIEIVPASSTAVDSVQKVING